MENKTKTRYARHDTVKTFLAECFPERRVSFPKNLRKEFTSGYIGLFHGYHVWFVPNQLFLYIFVFGI